VWVTGFAYVGLQKTTGSVLDRSGGMGIRRARMIPGRVPTRQKQCGGTEWERTVGDAAAAPRMRCAYPGYVAAHLAGCGALLPRGAMRFSSGRAAFLPRMRCVSTPGA